MSKKLLFLSGIFFLIFTSGRAQANAVSADKNTTVTTPSSQPAVNSLTITHYSDQKENITPTVLIDKEGGVEKKTGQIEHLNIRKEEELNPSPKK
jgi:hypothetical protein